MLPPPRFQAMKRRNLHHFSKMLKGKLEKGGNKGFIFYPVLLPFCEMCSWLKERGGTVVFFLTENIS